MYATIAYVGIAFNERNDAFDFNVALVCLYNILNESK